MRSHPSTTEAGRLALEALSADPTSTLLALDFDGTLAPIVDDPAHAHVHPRSVAAMARIGARIGMVAVITGRPVETAARLGGFVGLAGLEHMVILGQYGVERWDASTGQMVLPPIPGGITELLQSLPEWLRDHGHDDVRLEEKGRALVLHTRGLLDADERAKNLLDPVTQMAAAQGLVAEPGRQVIEVRDGHTDKGEALRRLVTETGLTNVLYAGDDLGDLPAFLVAEEMRTEGRTALRVCSASDEQDVLKAHADLVLDGPDAVATWLESIADAL